MLNICCRWIPKVGFDEEKLDVDCWFRGIEFDEEKWYDDCPREDLWILWNLNINKRIKDLRKKLTGGEAHPIVEDLFTNDEPNFLSRASIILRGSTPEGH